jgi:hypothetical protein
MIAPTATTGSASALMMAAERVGADGAALARGKDEHAPGHTFAFERVAGLDDYARIRVYPAQKADGVGGDEGLAFGVAGFDYAGRTRMAGHWRMKRITALLTFPDPLLSCDPCSENTDCRTPTDHTRTNTGRMAVS